MTPHHSLAALVDMLRSKGVKSFHGELEGKPVVLELGPEVVKDGPAQAATKDPDICNCKCPVYAHTGGLCLNGCEPLVCIGPEAT